MGPKNAPNDPWDGATLEWSLPSPPPPYNFAVAPVVRSRDAFWSWKRRPQAVEAGENVATVQIAGQHVGHVEFEEEHPSEEYMAQEGNAYHVDPSTMHMPNPSFFPIIAAAGLTLMAVGMIFGYVLTIAGVFVLRRKRPQAERPYKAFGYPLVPALYILAASAIMAVLILYKTSTTWPGLLIVLTGIPVYFLWRRRSAAA